MNDKTQKRKIKRIVDTTENLLRKQKEMQTGQADQEILQAEILLNQMEILTNQNAQDEAMAAILLNQMEV